MSANFVALLQSENGRRLVREKCRAVGLKLAVLEQLIHAEVDQSGKLRKSGINTDFDDIFGALDEED